jgi:hypothetical protein
MQEQRNLAENIAYTITAWFQTLGSTRFQLTVAAIAAVIYFGGKNLPANTLLSNAQWTQISILIVSWLLGESIRPHASIKRDAQGEQTAQGNVPSASSNEELLNDAIVKLNSISGPSSPVGPLIKAWLDVLETARMVLEKFRRF